MILAKLDKMEDTMVKQEVNLGKLSVSVEEHVKRSNMLEDAIRPIQKHVSMVEGAIKLITLLGVLVAIIEALHRVLV